MSKALLPWKTEAMDAAGVREMRDMWARRHEYGFGGVTQDAFVLIFRCGYFQGRIDILDEQLRRGMKYANEHGIALLKPQAG